MDFVEYHPTDLAHNLRPTVQHVAQNFRRHDQARGARIDRHVARHQTDVLELFVKLAILLVGKGLDRGGVDDALLVRERFRDRVLGHHRLAGGRVGRHQHGLIVLDAQDRFFLERIQHEGVLFRRFTGGRCERHRRQERSGSMSSSSSSSSTMIGISISSSVSVSVSIEEECSWSAAVPPLPSPIRSAPSLSCCFRDAQSPPSLLPLLEWTSGLPSPRPPCSLPESAVVAVVPAPPADAPARDAADGAGAAAATVVCHTIVSVFLLNSLPRASAFSATGRVLNPIVSDGSALSSWCFVTSPNCLKWSSSESASSSTNPVIRMVVGRRSTLVEPGGATRPTGPPLRPPPPYGPFWPGAIVAAAAAATAGPSGVRNVRVSCAICSSSASSISLSCCSFVLCFGPWGPGPRAVFAFSSWWSCSISLRRLLIFTCSSSSDSFSCGRRGSLTSYVTISSSSLRCSFRYPSIRNTFRSLMPLVNCSCRLRSISFCARLLPLLPPTPPPCNGAPVPGLMYLFALLPPCAFGPPGCCCCCGARFSFPFANGFASSFAWSVLPPATIGPVCVVPVAPAELRLLLMLYWFGPRGILRSSSEQLCCVFIICIEPGPPGPPPCPPPGLGPCRLCIGILRLPPPPIIMGPASAMATASSGSNRLLRWSADTSPPLFASTTGTEISSRCSGVAPIGLPAKPPPPCIGKPGDTPRNCTPIPPGPGPPRGPNPPPPRRWASAGRIPVATPPPPPPPPIPGGPCCTFGCLFHRAGASGLYSAAIGPRICAIMAGLFRPSSTSGSAPGTAVAAPPSPAAAFSTRSSAPADGGGTGATVGTTPPTGNDRHTARNAGRSNQRRHRIDYGHSIHHHTATGRCHRVTRHQSTTHRSGCCYRRLTDRRHRAGHLSTFGDGERLRECERILCERLLPTPLPPPLPLLPPPPDDAAFVPAPDPAIVPLAFGPLLRRSLYPFRSYRRNESLPRSGDLLRYEDERLPPDFESLPLPPRLPPPAPPPRGRCCSSRERDRRVSRGRSNDRDRDRERLRDRFCVRRLRRVLLLLLLLSLPCGMEKKCEEQI
uniref:Uncharacterized protein n=1 Tax=Anopheles coluzzii TaxID=1518534 RepID=A0A8W7PKD9_ANOCL